MTSIIFLCLLLENAWIVCRLSYSKVLMTFAIVQLRHVYAGSEIQLSI